MYISLHISLTYPSEILNLMLVRCDIDTIPEKEKY